MARVTAEIAADIRSFQPDGGNWLRLDALAQELWLCGTPTTAVADLLSVFERFPAEDGAGVFWGVLHGLEAIPGYEPALVRSVQSRPSEFGVLMVGRLLNSGVSEVAGARLVDLLRTVAARSEIDKRVREVAMDFAEEHGSRV